ncbi:aminopeptidase P family protein [Baekduia soli]|uniref:Aminopeptidase P family protein n=1 Tax=Baekduia soli TaxID=496014 RepID=A0A5B8U8A0_9ACTN|nr:M24 family metallopeptidase [Baekduia soli]QEC48902.1 aminopeptidase P family protein [Baekduia soli]
MTNLLLYSDTERSATLRHEIPLSIGDPFLFAEVDGAPAVLSNTLERDRIAAVRPGIRIIDYQDVGFRELLESGSPREEMMLEMVSRAVAQLGISEATVDPDFPLAVADRLRADGLALTPDHDTFAQRRRAKSGAELDGIRRAQHAAEAGMAAAAAVLRAATPDGDRLVRGDGTPLMAEHVREALRDACAAHGAPAPPDVIVASVWQGFGHEAGSGPLPAGLPIQIDLWPRDEVTGSWADMTRTFVVGELSDAVRAQEALVTRAFAAARDAARPGITGCELHASACDVFEAAGHRTQRTGPGEDPAEGFQFSLGHGVGLQVHEDPDLGQTGRAPLVAGDVIAIEPGLWERGVGGVRFEDLLLITDDGAQTLTDYPYDLTP